ncbi:M12 family metallopeptidase [Pedobacter zeae]|uniref:Peptidase M12A domain-containing protein n=1 Tax=Pedobacter zeae TaxID=1737356 RepID=A0A7W6KB19_9SPHI|nr:M12 family metallopeptidase [Pedobacter zeae]MBB4108495.1 hypothetical protein [Pedobacter zeae]GGG92435.1 hypothetical protein GCM10007422_01850 [Pedobacter zeae]
MKKIYYAVAALVIFMTACKKETSVKIEQSQNTPGKVITYHLKNGGQVTAQINDRGEYVVGGDVILSKDQIAYLEYNKVGDGKATTPRSTFTAEFQKLWPDGIVYYTISYTLNSSNIGLAINEWESNTPIRFVQRTNQPNYVDFTGSPSQGSGSSQLGMIGGRQEIKLEDNASFTTVVHEIGHAVGLMHEQTRADRDQYITVNYGNINSFWTSQYDTYSVQGESGSEIGTFDFNSVMLYRSNNAAARIGGNTAPQMTKKDGFTTWGDNYYLSQGDIDGVNYLYKPIYVKLVSVYNEEGSYYNSSITNEDARFEYFISLEFFSDAGFNTPIYLVNPVKIKYVNNFGSLQGNGGYPGELVVPAGNHSVYLGTALTEYSSEYGNYSYYNSNSFALSEGVGYKY